MPTSPTAIDEDDGLADLLAFDPVPMERRRRSGWNADRQRAFIVALAHYGVVADAARAVGMSARSAYQLRLKLGADSFDDAWARAQEEAVRDRKAELLDRSLNGDLVGVIRGGQLVGVRRELALGKQLRVFTALGRERDTRATRAMAAYDRQWRRNCTASRQAIERADRDAAAEADARRRTTERWLAEAEEKLQAARRPRVRGL
ncbi:hypothetical protein [Sphingomonas cavernae]|uniref:Uncharacterized protein n=1 Tax=Sphingomonas cavernae TaxID=2320861 RepID=A0A418WLL9_9SPHN|nr:hypothetical protein [Sphingomonas cavernae]RJF90890.1 hypothetical protein D3876_11995 [Sphingomonas cavernae]